MQQAEQCWNGSSQYTQMQQSSPLIPEQNPYVPNQSLNVQEPMQNITPPPMQSVPSGIVDSSVGAPQQNVNVFPQQQSVTQQFVPSYVAPMPAIPENPLTFQNMKKAKNFGMAAMILGICAVALGAIFTLTNCALGTLLITLVLGILALIFGLISMSKSKKLPVPMKKGMAISGIVLGICSIVLSAIFFCVGVAIVVDELNDMSTGYYSQYMLDDGDILGYNDNRLGTLRNFGTMA